MEFIQCEVCPNINITHESGTVVAVKCCVLEAALKHTKENYEVCGKEIELQLQQPQEVVDANQFAGLVDVDTAFQDSEIVESELVE
jgi:hypothetical protein